jgi:hypothetical protein
MRQSLRILFTVAFCVLLIGGIGCTRKTRRTQTRASGTVTANGRPVPVGKITFRPTNGVGKSHTDIIHNGYYSVRSRYTMPAGEYDVTIDSSSKDGLGGDRHHTERVTVGPLGTHHIDFHLN